MPHEQDQKIKFETPTGVYTDVIQTDTSVFKTTWSLITPTNLMKLDSFYRDLSIYWDFAGCYEKGVLRKRQKSNITPNLSINNII